MLLFNILTACVLFLVFYVISATYLFYVANKFHKSTVDEVARTKQCFKLDSLAVFQA